MRFQPMRPRAMAAACAAFLVVAPTTMAAAQPYSQRLPQDEFIYFVLPDRFENGDARNDRGRFRGWRLETGYDPTHKGFFHGGDLRGLTRRLDYVQGLGATAIWLGPIYRNKPVQGPRGQESAGYHGYWITDFTDVDPHFGTRDDLKAFVDAAHARGMKIYLDIITNHTADVIRYRECDESVDCPYRSRANYPYSRETGSGRPINEGFLGETNQSRENFARLVDPNYAYGVYVPPEEADVKRPAWLNDPLYYHNRGNFGDPGESFMHGDFFGLDDLFTEHPRVLEGMIEIYGRWIDEFGIDGFRVDTARHVNPEFWQAFVPAMRERARARGIPNFHIFGEVFDPDIAALARHTRTDRLPAVLDFAFQAAAADAIARGTGTDRLARVFAGDAVYEGGEAAAMQLPTFLGNHDMGRFAHFVRAANPNMGDEEQLRRVALGHALMMFSRGVPVIYYGDEQGFVGDGGDQDAREDMFASRVAVYNDNRLVGTNATTASSNFNTNAPLYRRISEMAGIRAADPALRRGRQIVRAFSVRPGLFAFSRKLEGRGETLVALNTSTSPVSARVEVDATSLAWRSSHGRCAPTAVAPGSYAVEIAALDYIVCVAEAAQ